MCPESDEATSEREQRETQQAVSVWLFISLRKLRQLPVSSHIHRHIVRTHDRDQHLDLAVPALRASASLSMLELHAPSDAPRESRVRGLAGLRFKARFKGWLDSNVSRMFPRLLKKCMSVWSKRRDGCIADIKGGEIQAD
jgi:hypothetical protein